MSRFSRHVPVALLVATLCAWSCEANALPQQPALGRAFCRWTGLGETSHSFEQTSSLWARRFSPGKEQLHESSCGPAVLANLLTIFFGCPTDEAAIMEEEPEIQARSSLATLLQSARSCGFAASVYLMDADLLRLVLTEVRVPVIGLLRKPADHFVIAVASVRRDILVFDPALGFGVLSDQHLADRWSGFALVVDPGIECVDDCSDRVAALVHRYEQRRRHLDELTWIVP